MQQVQGFSGGEIALKSTVVTVSQLCEYSRLIVHYKCVDLMEFELYLNVLKLKMEKN